MEAEGKGKAVRDSCSRAGKEENKVVNREKGSRKGQNTTDIQAVSSSTSF
jgi:hypothetical protein